MTLPDNLQRLLERDKLGRMWVDVGIPSNAEVHVKVLPNPERGPDRFVLDIRWNDEAGKLFLYCDQTIVEAIHKATEPRVE